ncbi:cupin domain-containing protein [Trujillonella endophytica]|uniref:Putative monooxygenase n=1 Tax=Trujillonella endophytica TaxID=673521 RepID=A0A1H8WEG8_9ACTN|nr:cupin domain-containing protein [Trujillella endophytica]SEP25827.1 putative monooxygenase [Trujillella endophytica]
MTTIQHAPSAVRVGPTVSRAATPPNRRRGGDIRVLLSPANVGTTAAFMGTLTLEPGEVVREHWHPYSEEFLYCQRGDVLVTLDGEPRRLGAESAVHIPIGVRHRIVNDGDTAAFFVFCNGPLAPRPELGHVDTEPAPDLR